jgi:transposase
MDLSIIFFFAAVIIIGGLLFALIGLTKKGSKHLNMEQYRVKWLSIEQQLKKDQPASFSLCVLNADKLLDQALRERGLKGQTMAERMKSGAQLFSNRNNLWTAHKLRNRIAHETDVRVSYDDARYALSYFKQALKDVGAI